MAVVALRQLKPLTPGTRWCKKLKLVKNTSKINPMFRVYKPWHAGRGSGGRVFSKTFTSRKFKKKITIQVVKVSFFDIAVSCSHHFTFEKHKPKTIFKTKSGGSFIMPATPTNFPGRVYYSQDRYTPTFKRFFSGLPIEINLAPYYSRLSNISTQPFYKFQYATSSGTFCTKLRASKREKNLKLILPSKQYKFFTPKSLAILGPNNQQWLYKLNLGKAGGLINRGLKQQVRGIAMNSVDHPHGGKANSIQPEVSPWGWVTKKSH